MNEAIIEVKNLSKVYNLYAKPIDRLKESLSFTRKTYHQTHYALQDISFVVNQGEIFGIIGVNGAGKSTLLKIITGVLSKSSGEINCKGKIAALLELGTGFNMEYSGLQNIYLNGTMMGYSKNEIQEKMNSIIEFADIGEFINQPIKTYSSGMLARLAFAVSINVDPDILIVDEALSVGDIFFQAKCYKKFDEFKDKGKTIIFVSHDLGSMLKYCSRGILLNKGRLVKQGEIKSIVDEYKKILVQTSDTNEEEHKLDINLTNKSKLNLNPDFLEYGNGSASIIDYSILNSTGEITNTLFKDENCAFKMVVKFEKRIIDPIFAYTIKDLKGVELVGTNTVIEKIDTGIFEAGDMVEIVFEQSMKLQGSNYLISFGCTGYAADGELHVYHRLYDITNVEVISHKNTVGVFDMNTFITMQKR